MLVYNYYTVGEQKILQKSAILFGRRSNTMTKNIFIFGDFNWPKLEALFLSVLKHCALVINGIELANQKGFRVELTSFD